AVMRDLEGPLGRQISDFARQMEQVRRQLRTGAESYFRLNRQSWFLTAAGSYTRAIGQLLDDLQHREAASPGLKGMRDYVARYAASGSFQMLAVDTKEGRDGAGVGPLLHAHPR